MVCNVTTSYVVVMTGNVRTGSSHFGDIKTEWFMKLGVEELLQCKRCYHMSELYVGDLVIRSRGGIIW